MKLLAIDPGKSCGWASFSGTKYCDSGVCQGDDVNECDAILESINPSVVVIEDQFIRLSDKKGKPVNSQKGIKTLIRRAACWEILAKRWNLDVHYVNPKTWQSYLKIKTGDKYTMQNLATTLINRSTQPDECDAILIGLWGASTLLSLRETIRRNVRLKRGQK